jgi:glycosyltransferase involved in cell wall biosynthesis
MRIAQVSTPYAPVRETSGSTEGLVWLLTRELARRGHEVTVFGAAGSEVDGEVVEALPGVCGDPAVPGDWRLCELICHARAVAESGRFDVVHCHSTAHLPGLALEPFARAPLVHTLHVMPWSDQALLWSGAPGACVTAISREQWRAFPALCPAATIHHAVDPTQFSFRAEPTDYVCFLGLMKPEKGPLGAIAAAKALGLKLRLAGPPSAYFEESVAPLVDGRDVEYAGFVAGAARDRLLGGARALLYPLAAAEPFGLVQVEAMMCGTPVAAIGIGAVPEVVDEGVTGAIAGDAASFPDAVRRALALDRAAVRARAEARFAPARMAEAYARVYAGAAARGRP